VFNSSPSTVRLLLASRIFFGAGGCLPIWHGAGGLTTNSPPSRLCLIYHHQHFRVRDGDELEMINPPEPFANGSSTSGKKGELVFF
jgi:hypothetical protein